MRTAAVPHAGVMVFLPLVLAVVVARIAGSLLFPTYDDAFITYRYARNLVHGVGFVYNPNEHVLGVTAPLFAVIPAILEILHLLVPAGTLAVNVACDLISIYLVYRLLGPDTSPLTWICFGLLFAASPILVRVTVGGMEANLFVVLLLTAMYLVSRGAIGSALIVAAAAFWLRPEALMLLGLIVLWSARTKHTRGMLWAAGVALLILVIPAGVVAAVYGSIIPQTVATKAAQHSSVLGVLRQLLWPDFLALAVLPFAVSGLIWTWVRHRELRLLSLWGMAYLSAYLIMRPNVWSWYAVPFQCT